MPTQDSSEDRIALLQGTLDLLILKILLLGPCHGQGAEFSAAMSDERIRSDSGLDEDLGHYR